MVLGPLALLVHRRWPIGVAAVTLGTSALYLALGYAYGPVFLSVVFGLYWAVQSGRRTAAFVVAGLGYTAYVVASVIDPFANGLDAVRLALVAGWMAVVLALSELARVNAPRSDATGSRAIEAEQARAEAEHVRIAQDLHDVLAHHISLINVQSSVALHLIDDDPGRRETPWRTSNWPAAMHSESCAPRSTSCAPATRRERRARRSPISTSWSTGCAPADCRWSCTSTTSARPRPRSNSPATASSRRP